MRSAYQILGIPGNAEQQEILSAFEKAQQFYDRQRLAAVDGAVEKFNEIQLAFNILKDPASRAAHDRKLASAPKAAPRTARSVTAPADEAARPPYLTFGLALVAVIFAVGFYINHKNTQVRKEQAALEQAALKEQEKQAAERQKEAERLESERARLAAKAEADERRFASESRAIAAQAASERARTEAAAAQMQRAAASDAQRREAALLAEKRRAEYEAQRRIAADKQRVRELCYLNYRRPDC
jgi:curved DNA-binding protein CbpA